MPLPLLRDGFWPQLVQGGWSPLSGVGSGEVIAVCSPLGVAPVVGGLDVVEGLAAVGDGGDVVGDEGVWVGPSDMGIEVVATEPAFVAVGAPDGEGLGAVFSAGGAVVSWVFGHGGTFPQNISCF